MQNSTKRIPGSHLRSMDVGLSGRLNQALGSVSFRAAGPFSLNAGDLVLDFTPAWDFQDINHRRLSLSGGRSILRPAYVRVILSVSGTFHPDCDEPNVWVIEDLGLLKLGGSIDIDVTPDAEFRLVFVDPIGPYCCEVPVDGGQSCRVNLPGSATGWSVSDRRFVIRADNEMPAMAYMTAAPQTVTRIFYDTFVDKAAAYCINDFAGMWQFLGSEIRKAFIDAAILRLHNQRDDAWLHSENVQEIRDMVAAKLAEQGYII